MWRSKFKEKTECQVSLPSLSLALRRSVICLLGCPFTFSLCTYEHREESTSLDKSGACYLYRSAPYVARLIEHPRDRSASVVRTATEHSAVCTNCLVRGQSPPATVLPSPATLRVPVPSTEADRELNHPKGCAESKSISCRCS